MVDRVGQQLGSYRLIRLLGKGGFADVYLGEHIYLNTKVAVKVLQTQLASEGIEEFLTESRTIAGLVHPNIIRVLDFGVMNSIPFLVMDYAPNGTLRQHHPKGTRIPLPTVVSYIKQITVALQYTHDQKLIHRDIKPENMLLGQRNEVLLSDFGIALVAQSSRYQSTQDVVGTVSYMSPEQIQGKPRPASDQYSLGIVVYEWLSGDRPFHGSFTELCTQHIFASPQPLSEKIPEISSAIDIVVLTALAKDPQQRFATVRAFANALEHASKFAQPTDRVVLPNPSPLSSLARIQPTDVISSLPTAPVINPLSTTQPKDDSPVPSFIPPASPLSSQDQTVSVVPFSPSSVSNNPTVVAPLVPPVFSTEKIPSSGLSMAACPYCGAEIRPGDNFCLNCGNRLFPAIPSSQQPQPLIGGDATVQAQDDPGNLTYRAQDNKGGTLIGNPTMASVISPWPENPDASVLAGDQIEAMAPPSTVLKTSTSASPPPRTDLRSTPASDQTKEHRLKEGENYYRAKRYEEALRMYESVIQMDPQDARAYSNKGNVLRKLKRYKEALAAYEHALTIDVNNAFIWVSKGNILYSLKDYDEALVAYNHALGINPNNAFIWTSKGNVLYSLKRYDEALNAYDSALAITLGDASTWTAKGEVLFKLKHYDEALDAYDHAIALTPNDVGMWISKGNKLYKLKRYDEALDAYDRVLAINAINAAIWSNKGNVLYQLERYDEALDAYNRALTITPRKARVWSDKGAVLYKLERYDEALDAYKLARFLDPNDTSISHRYDMLCDRLLDLKRRQEEPEQAQAKKQPYSKTFSSDSPSVKQPISVQADHSVPHHHEKSKETKKAAENTLLVKQFDVFLSHSHTDAEWVKNLAMRLEDEHGFHVWLDKWMLIPGQPWQQSLAQGIDQAHCCAVCIGEQTPIGWFKEEIQRALNRQTKDPSFRVFAILLPNAKDINVDDFLELNTWVDFRNSDIEYAFHILASGVKGNPPGRWPPKEAPTLKTSPYVEDKLRDLHRFKQENWVDPSVALEFQRMVLKKLWLDVDESKGQQE